MAPPVPCADAPRESAEGATQQARRSTSSNGNGNGSCSSSEADELGLLLRDAASAFSDYVSESVDDGSSIVSDEPPEALLQRLDLSFPEKGVGRDGIWSDVRDVCGAATNTWSDRFLYKLYASPTPIGVVSEALMGLLNNNAHVYKSSPIGTVLEATLSVKLAELANFPSTAGGLTFPGGSYSNMHALMVARNQRFPELKSGGYAALIGTRPVIFTSAHAHYSIEKSAVAAGIGLDNIVYVPTDDKGRMDAIALRSLVTRSIAEGGAPFFVNATAGTTVLGAFDPVAEIAAVCREFSLWLHLDGSWGSPLALFADPATFDFRIPAGAVDSFTINPHKLLGVPLQCSFLLMRDGLGTMKEALGLNANYLFHSSPGAEAEDVAAASFRERLGGSWDVGDATMGCGRRPDAIKMWVTWRYYGTQYFRNRVCRARQLAVMLAGMVKARKSDSGVWRLFSEPQSTCVCFWFVPCWLCDNSTLASHLEDGSYACCSDKLSQVTKAVCKDVNNSGKMLIDYATIDLFSDDDNAKGAVKHTVPSFFRIPLNNPNVTSDTLAFVLDAIEDSACKLFPPSVQCHPAP